MVLDGLASGDGVVALDSDADAVPRESSDHSAPTCFAFALLGVFEGGVAEPEDADGLRGSCWTERGVSEALPVSGGEAEVAPP